MADEQDGIFQEMHSQHDISSTHNKLHLLAHSLKRIKKVYKQFAGPLYVDITGEPIGLNCIEEKLDTYKKFDDYQNDITNLVQAMTANSNDEKLRQAGKELKKEIARDVKSIQDCAECFENWVHDNFAYFVQVCNTPHLLVLAKFGGFRYWPAKVMSVAGDKVTVEFFGDHSQADVPQENCYLYRKPKLTTDALFNAAVKEIEEHIANIVKKFGSFVPASKIRTNYYAGNQKDHLRSMFPDAYPVESTISSLEARLSLSSVSSTQTRRSVGTSNVNFSVTSRGSTDDIQTPMRKRRGNNVTNEAVPHKKTIEENLFVSDQRQTDQEPSPAFSPSVLLSRTKDQKIRELEQQLKEKNDELNQARQQIQNQSTQIRNLQEQIVSMGNGPECLKCGNGPNELFFCSPECQNGFEHDGSSVSD